MDLFDLFDSEIVLRMKLNAQRSQERLQLEQFPPVPGRQHQAIENRGAQRNAIRSMASDET
jgi:hypothetical protein